ncbi:MAG: hypothetical protein UY48_C0045G0004 [Candidatus Gottesmanbacteria bacterium GW2011_GWB1_49_7]|uniref:Uncharacterized protein n=1 Tax=Candidatus Gottesmanbacteria bacterium GW2011_GWB1_49_7 TaxID=1618448 RepID=A0A0G1VUN0_9BACT|nr:MAG: hypothetical protein UY48_C0045G0004 [Candidatus Gottesmanbacteria bacterium GW2011_GWB1_49_7]
MSCLTFWWTTLISIYLPAVVAVLLCFLLLAPVILLCMFSFYLAQEKFRIPWLTVPIYLFLCTNYFIFLVVTIHTLGNCLGVVQ